ncbi:sulfur carrier protein ThiS [Halobacillus salinarum]|uniref:Sulfur carrier protein ThiS n=1 Tax=Halobacillus salinarum TaxID=2932257 RepID=A0ABY4EED9_9BACI|nr:sulfur carrier protein ThiS [Halobacillus salinarum]UOQ42834.1 sulfur carrier protein ThiS [Halobacillus salinarum]
MSIQVNGKVIELEDGAFSIDELLEKFQLQKKISVVEHNKTIVKKEDYSRIQLTEGDQLEIVHFVGGG